MKFENRRGKAEAIPAKDMVQAVAIGKSWSKRETFIVIDEEGNRVAEYRNGSKV